MANFNIGDKVKIKTGPCLGAVGEIVFIRNSYRPFPYTVLFDKRINILPRKSIQAKEVIKMGYDYKKCFVYNDKELELIQERKESEKC